MKRRTFLKSAALSSLSVPISSVGYTNVSNGHSGGCKIVVRVDKSYTELVGKFKSTPLDVSPADLEFINRLDVEEVSDKVVDDFTKRLSDWCGQYKPIMLAIIELAEKEEMVFELCERAYKGDVGLGFCIIAENHYSPELVVGGVIHESLETKEENVSKLALLTKNHIDCYIYDDMCDLGNSYLWDVVMKPVL